MSTMEAIQWMLEHEGDADIDKPLAVENPAVAAAADTTKGPLTASLSQAGGGLPRPRVCTFTHPLRALTKSALCLHEK